MVVHLLASRCRSPISNLVSLIHARPDMDTSTKVEVQTPLEVKFAWHVMSISNIDSLVHVANKIHPNLPESAQVFAERIKLFPEGCLALMGNETDELFGYIISHPIRYRQPPALNSFLTEIAPDADQYYIHDLAILPELRGRGLAKEGVWFECVLGEVWVCG